jgi:hypothetical protein
MNQTFVSRQFIVEGSPVECRFSKPQSDGNDFRCLYEIGWPDHPQSRWVYGVDEVQALLLAMQGAHLDLLMSREKRGVEVQWLDMTSLGLPLAQSLRDMDPQGYF